MGNLDGNLYGLGGYKDNVSKEWESKKGYYKLAFVESFDKMTDRDVDIRQEYAKDLIATYVKVPKSMVVFRKKSSTTSLASLDEVFYVKIGKSTVGKISIRVQRTFTQTTLSFVFQEKSIRDVASKHKKGMRTFGGKSKADTRQANRRNRKGKKKS